MTEEKLNLIIAALTTLSVETDAEADGIVEALVGLCWDEEDGSLIERTIRGELKDDQYFMVAAYRRFNWVYSGKNYTMTNEKYSPTTQAVSDAIKEEYLLWEALHPGDAERIAAAALRAAVDAVVPENANDVGDEHDDARNDQWMRIRYEFLSIVAELEETK